MAKTVGIDLGTTNSAEGRYWRPWLTLSWRKRILTK